MNCTLIMRGNRFNNFQYDVVSNTHTHTQKCFIVFWLEKSGRYRKLYGAELVQVTMGKVGTIKDRIKVAHDR